MSYDSFCRSAAESTRRLVEFAGVEATPVRVTSLARLAHIPKSIGRFKLSGLGAFDSDDIRYVKSLGFDTDER